MNESTRLMLARLAAPFPPGAIHWRVGSTMKDKSRGMALAYLDGRDVQDRLDLVLGQGGWQCRHEVFNKANDIVVICHLGLLLDDQWVWKSDGAGETGTEGVKGAISDSLKRAAVQWGVGRYLYRLDSPWVALVEKGKSHVIAESEQKRLNEILADAAYDSSPIIEGARIDVDGNALLTREDLTNLYRMAQQRLKTLDIAPKDFTPEMVMRDMVVGTPYEGFTPRELCVAPRNMLGQFKNNVEAWKPRQEVEDF